MTVDVVMPKMGESIQEGKILKWHKQAGDKVARDEVLFEISTDKVDTEVPSSTDGVITSIAFPEGATVAVGTVLATIDTDTNAKAAPAVAATASSAPAGVPASAKSAAVPASEIPGSVPAPSAAPSPAAAPTAPASPAPASPAPASPAPASPAPASPAPASPAPANSGPRVDIVMPKMGESIQEGKILKWAKKAGDKVERDEVLFEISTDKVDTEVPSPAAGVLTEILFPEGSTVNVGTVVAYLGSAAGAASAASPATAPAKATAPVAAPSNGATTAKVAAPIAAQAVVAGATPPQRMSGSRFYSPVVRTIATQEKISLEELDSLTGTGLDGRVTKIDLLGYMKTRGARPAAAAPATATISTPKGTPAMMAGEEVEIVPMDHIRQLIAEHMVLSKKTSPHVTAVHEVDFTKIEKFRAANKDEFKKREGISLTPTPFIAHAVVQALREFRFVNASVDGTNIIVKKHINLGMATALADGSLIVPVIKDADNLTITGIARAVNDLATRARSKKLKPEEIQGGTFTITNYGVFGSLFGTPIINQPQVAILGTGVIQKRPVVRELDGTDYIIIRHMGYLSLSHDHRLVDGMMGGQFMSRIVQLLEGFDPETTKL